MPIESIEVEVWTRDEAGAGTDEEIRCTVRIDGAPDLDVRLDIPGVNNFRRSAKEVFPIGPIPAAVAALSPDAILGVRIRSLAKPAMPDLPPPVWMAAAVGLRVNGLLLMSRWAWRDLPPAEIAADRRPVGALDGLELEIETGDIPRGDTDDRVYCSVRLDSGVDIVTDLRLHYPRENDFERGARRKYMLPLPSDLSSSVTPDQIARITIRKSGDDGWLLGGASLFANGALSFRNRSINQFLDDSAAVLAWRSWVSDRVTGPVLGGLGADFARIQVRFETPGPVEVHLTPPSGAAIVASASVTPAGVVQVDGLAPDTTYEYRLVRSGVDVPNTDGRLRTFPPEDQGGRFAFAFGSCVRNRFDSIQRGWEQLLRFSDALRFFLHLGDTFYFYDDDILDTGDVADANDVERAMKAAHLSSRLHPSFLRMARRLPTVAVWDDHDFRGDGSIGEGFAKLVDARDAFLSYWGNPDLGLNWRRFGLTSRLSVGRADVYIMDGRFNRTLFKGDFFGKGQCDLILSAIDERATTLGPRVVFLASGSPWHAMDHTDSYSQHFMFVPLYGEERAMFLGGLASRVRNGRIRGLVLLSGDVHRAEIYEVDLGDGVVAPELVSSALAMPNNDTDSRSITDQRRYSRGVDPSDGSYASFCRVSVDTSAESPNDNWSLRVDHRRSDNGEIFFTKRYVLTDNQFVWR
jgi:hypothetical protein